MKITEISFERKFILGQRANMESETYRVGIRVSLEGDETAESVEEKALDGLYAAADRERKRRWGKLKQWAQKKNSPKPNSPRLPGRRINQGIAEANKK